MVRQLKQRRLPAQLTARLRLVQWALPSTIGLVAVIYQLGPARWVQELSGHAAHYTIEILFYGSIGPLATWLTLRWVRRQLEEKEAAERSAAETQVYLAAITTDSADAILSLDLGQTIRTWNRGAELMFGHTAEEAVGRSLDLIVPPELSAQREPEEILARVQEQGFVRGLQTERLAKGGRRLTVELTSTLLRDKEGQPTRFSLVLRDVTDRHQHELALRHLSQDLAERVEARTRELASSNRELQRANAELQELDQLKSEVVSLVTHQLSAPLTNMRGAIELVRNRCATPNTTCVRMFGLLETQSARLNRLVTDILNVSRLEAGQLALQLCAVDLPQLADRVVDEIAPHHPDRRIHRPGDGREAISPALADPDRAQEIIANLLDNALKYSPPGSPIEVRVRSTPEGINLSVTDYGPGIPPGEQERIFEKFHRLERGDAQETYGHGLGLYFCRKLVEAQGGRIWVECAPGRRTTFAFTLPAAPQVGREAG